MASLKTTEITSKNNLFKPGIDLVCVIDRSSSMIGEKISLVIKTLNYIVDLLDENDRLCLINFGYTG